MQIQELRLRDDERSLSLSKIPIRLSLTQSVASWRRKSRKEDALHCHSNESQAVILDIRRSNPVAIGLVHRVRETRQLDSRSGTYGMQLQRVTGEHPCSKRATQTRKREHTKMKEIKRATNTNIEK
jgi:hypothetical protein